MEKTIIIAAFVRKSIAVRSAICKYLKRSSIPMWLPTATRWYSYPTTLEHVMSVREAISIVFIQERDRPHLKTETAKTVQEIINDTYFWDNCKELYELMKPYSVITGISEMEFCSAGLILASWAWLRQATLQNTFLTMAEKDVLERKIIARIDKFVSSHQLVCWMLDPRSRGCGLTGAGRRHVRDMGKELFSSLFPDGGGSNNLMKEWLMYEHRNGIFSESGSVWSPCLVNHPYAFWCDVEDDAPHLARLAKGVLGCMPHTASCERLWSAAAATSTKARNRLSPEKLAMMMQVKHHHTKRRPTDRQNTMKKVQRLVGDVTGGRTDSSEDSVSTTSWIDGANEYEACGDERVVETVCDLLDGWDQEDDLFEHPEPPSDTHTYLDGNCGDKVIRLIQYVFESL